MGNTANRSIGYSPLKNRDISKIDLNPEDLLDGQLDSRYEDILFETKRLTDIDKLKSMDPNKELVDKLKSSMDKLKSMDPNNELVDKLKLSMDKREQEAYDRLEKIIYSFKTKEDVLNFITPYIKEGYKGVIIFRDPFLFHKSYLDRLCQFEYYILRITDGEIGLERGRIDWILSLKIHNVYITETCVNCMNFDPIKHKIIEIL